MTDLGLKAGERGIILGMTRVGKSTLAEQLFAQWRLSYGKRQRTVILDSKPRFRAQYELDGRRTSISGRYRNWDWGVEVPNSVVLPLVNVEQELHQAWSLGYDCVIAQIYDRIDIWKLDQVIKIAYMKRKKGKLLFFYVDEVNNFFRSEGRRASGGIVMVLTSGGERSVAFLGAAQRPRNISVEAIESLTKLYWFYTPYGEDIKHLKDMGVPQTARPPQQYYRFYFFDRMTRREGLCQLVLPSKKGTKTNGGR